MTEDKIKEIENETKIEYTINRCGWDKQKMQERRNKIKKIYKAANPYTNEKTVDEYANAISNGELTLREIEEIQTELAKEKVESTANLGVLDTKDKGKDQGKEMTERKQAITKVLENLNLYNNAQTRDYIAEGYAVRNLTLEQVEDLVNDLKVKEDLVKASNQRHFPGVL